MKRQTTYKGITIETELIFNFRAERGLNGRKWHKISVKTISDKVVERFESSDEIISTVENSTILALCEHNEIKVKDFIDKKEKVSELEQFFIQNGFVK
jgi:DNA-binding Xre family transcriptional regulator